MLKSLALIIPVALGCLLAARVAVTEPLSSTVSPGHWESLVLGGHAFKLLLPASYNANEKYPLVLFLHGQGDDVVDPLTPPPVAEAAFNSVDFRARHPALVLAPQCVGSADTKVCSWGGAQAGERMGEAMAMDLIRHVTSQYSVDTDRIYVTGVSLGGNGAWDMIWRYNDVFAAAMPISGATWYWKTAHAKDLLSTPIWALHGELDPEVPVQYDRDFYAAVKTLGGSKMRYTEFAGKAHEIWNDVYADPAHLNWLFEQRLSSRPKLETTCGKVASPHPWSYCVTVTKGSRNRDVVYQLHGADENEHTWTDLKHGQQIRDRWALNAHDAPVVVTVSFGPFWVLVPKNQAPESGLADVFISEVMPYVESHLLPMPIRDRKLFGISIGGFNAASLMLSRPDLFKSVALTCPALMRLSPYASEAEISAYIARSPGGEPDWIREMIRQSSPYYPDAASWNSESPLFLAKRTMNTNFPALYVSAGRTDEFGIIEGAHDLAMTARSAGIATEWVPLDGGHCVMDPDSIADFLIR